MKIIHLVSSLGIGGAEKFVTDLSLEQKKLGHELVVIVLDNAIDVEKDEIYEKNLLEQLKINDIQVYFMGSKSRKRPFMVYQKLKNIIKNENPDIIHSHLFIWSLFLSLYPKRFFHIFTQHINRLKFPIVHKYFLKKRIDAYIAICDETKNDFDKYIPNVFSKKIINGVNLKSFSSSICHDFYRVLDESDDLNFVTVSRLTYQKNHELLLDAIQNISINYPLFKFNLKIVGDGPLLNHLKDKVMELNISKYVTFLGTRTDIPNILRQNDVFILPSRFEGFSIALIEAVSSGIDIIATDVSGNSDILDNGKFGTLIAEGSQIELVNAMVDRITNNRKFYDTNDLNKHLASLSIDFCSKKHIQLYKNLLS